MQSLFIRAVNIVTLVNITFHLQGYPREYDVTSIVSEVEELSLYSASSRKHSLVTSESSGGHTRRRHRSGRGEEPRGSVTTKSEPPSPGHSCYR